MQTTFWKWQDKGNFGIIISRNLLLKLGLQKNAANYIKIKTTFNSSYILSCFVGHPVYNQGYIFCLGIHIFRRTYITKVTSFIRKRRFQNNLHHQTYIFSSGKTSSKVHVAPSFSSGKTKPLQKYISL